MTQLRLVFNFVTQYNKRIPTITTVLSQL